jgi:hypothetical protein
VLEVLDPDLLVDRERVVPMQREPQAVLEQRDHLDALRGPVVEVDGERDVEPPLAQLRDALTRARLPHGELDRGMTRAEGVDRARQDARPGGRERGHPKVPAPQGGERRERGLGRLKPVEDLLGVLHQGLARLGEDDPASAALEQPRARLALEHGDLLRDGRGRVGEDVGGTRQRAAACDLSQHTQSADVQHARNVPAPRSRHERRSPRWDGRTSAARQPLPSRR